MDTKKNLRTSLFMDVLELSKEYMRFPVIVSDLSRESIFVPSEDIEENTHVIQLFRAYEKKYEKSESYKEKIGLLRAAESTFLMDIKKLQEKNMKEEKKALEALHKNFQVTHPKKSSYK